MSARLDLKRVRYCENHDSHWVPAVGMSEKSSSCPWCQRDALSNELEDIATSFRSAIDAKFKRCQYNGNFANVPSSSIRDMEWYLKKWEPFLILNRNNKRGF